MQNVSFTNLDYLASVLSVLLQYMDSDYPFGIFKLFMAYLVKDQTSFWRPSLVSRLILLKSMCRIGCDGPWVVLFTNCVQRLCLLLLHKK